MGRCRVVQPDTTRLDISDGDWLEAKRRLTHGDVRDRIVSLSSDDGKDGRATLNRAMVGIADILAWVVDWSLRDAQGQPLPINASAIRQLDQESYEEIVDAVGLHETRMDLERTAEKKSQAGANTSNSTSASAA